MSKTPRTTQTDPRATLLARVVTAVWNVTTARDEAIAALKAAGPEQEDVEAQVLRTYMARRMYPDATAPTPAMLKAAQAVLALPNAKSQHAKKRTQEQDRFYGGARVMLLGLRKAAGVAPIHNNGGANNTGPRAPRTSNGDEEMIPTAPPAGKNEPQTEPEVRNHVAAQTATLMAYVEKHRARGVCGDKTVAEVARMLKIAKALAGIK